MSAPNRFYINVWDKCNLNCSHCFNENGRVKGMVLSGEEIMAAIKSAGNYHKIDEVQLTGGEPTLRPDIFSIIWKLTNAGLVVLLQTNGTFGQKTIDEIKSLPCEMVKLIISLDGLKTNDLYRGKDATKRTIHNIVSLHNIFDIRINTVLSAAITWQEIEELAALAENYNLTLSLNPACPAGRAEKSILMPPERYFDFMIRLEDLRGKGIKIRKCFNIIRNQLVENTNCPVRTGKAIHIAADGSVSPCGFLANNPECQIGNIRSSSISELYDNYPEVCTKLAERCQNCSYYESEYCFGGCPARIYGTNGSFDVPDYYCMADYYGKGQTSD